MEEMFDVLDEDGKYTFEVASRSDCHKNGLWHRLVILFVVSEDNKRILLQKRSSNKKIWPNIWYCTSSGHVLAGEVLKDALVRETKEEIGVDILDCDLKFLGCTKSSFNYEDYFVRHFNEFYVIHKDIDISDIILQEEEVSFVKWFSVEEFFDLIGDSRINEVGVWELIYEYLKDLE